MFLDDIFHGNSHHARQGGALIQYIFRRHSYYLIDEFQDTNPIQSEIFFYLTAEHPVENWQHCDPKPGTLFIVGDPKQSIYRFRNADVGSYLRVNHNLLLNLLNVPNKQYRL